MRTIHVFPLADPESRSLFCGRFMDGDGWTTVPKAVTCPECRRRLVAAAVAVPPAETPLDEGAQADDARARNGSIR